jgi:hypothetical protein
MSLKHAFLLLLVFLWVAEPFTGLPLSQDKTATKIRCHMKNPCHMACCCHAGSASLLSCDGQLGFYDGGCKPKESHALTSSQSLAKWFAPAGLFHFPTASTDRFTVSFISLSTPPDFHITPPPRWNGIG